MWNRKTILPSFTFLKKKQCKDAITVVVYRHVNMLVVARDYFDALVDHDPEVTV